MNASTDGHAKAVQYRAKRLPGYRRSLRMVQPFARMRHGRFADDGEAIIAHDAKLLFSLPASTIKIQRSRQNRRTRVNSSGDFATFRLTPTAFRRQPNLRRCRIVATIVALIYVEHVARATTTSSDPCGTMNLDDARSLAATLMQQHNVPQDWSFGFDHSKVRFGKCDYRQEADLAVPPFGGSERCGPGPGHHSARDCSCPCHPQGRPWARLAIHGIDDRLHRPAVLRQ